MKVNKTYKLQNGILSVQTHIEHKLSDVKLFILHSIINNGNYVTQYKCSCSEECEEEHEAMRNLEFLGLVEEDDFAWYLTVKPVDIDTIKSLLEVK